MAKELSNRGHRVTFYTLHDALKKVEAHGFRAQTYGAEEFGEDEIQKAYETLGKLSGLKAVRFTIDMMKRSAGAALSELPALVREDRCDGLVVDQLTPWGGSVARSMDIPFVNICNALPVNIDSTTPPIFTKFMPAKTWLGRLRVSLLNRLQIHLGKPIVDTIGQFHRNNGLDEYAPRSTKRYELAEIAQIPAEFDFPNRQLHDRFHYAAPFHSLESRNSTEFPWDKIRNDVPIIYASMGTIQNRLRHVFEVVAEACESLPVQLVISLGGGARTEEFTKLAGDPVVVHYAPQLEILQRSSVCITHAGMNTTLECLTHGTPMLAIPVTNDQPGVSTRIEFRQAGIRMQLKKLDVREVRRNLERLLDDPMFLTTAKSLEAKLASISGPATAANIIEEAFESGKPVLSNG